MILLQHLLRLHSEFNEKAQEIMEKIIKTPKRESRPPTPLPEVSQEEADDWMDVSPVKVGLGYLFLREL